MPGYVNIGARVGAGTMIDTWATVGSGAQVGRDVHLAGGVGIGGVLEPPGARPVIVEDGCFLGSRAIVTEGLACRGGGRARRRRRAHRLDPDPRRDRPEVVELIRGRIPAALRRRPGHPPAQLPRAASTDCPAR